MSESKISFCNKLLSTNGLTYLTKFVLPKYLFIYGHLLELSQGTGCITALLAYTL